MRAVGEQTARELCYTGRTVAAEEGLELGVYLDVVEPDELTDRAESLATTIADAPRASVTLTKRNLNLSRDNPTEDTLAHNFYSFSVAYSQPEVQEYIDAYIEENL
jgi:enoyl-CoA hydratase/carnithine racemase